MEQESHLQNSFRDEELFRRHLNLTSLCSIGFAVVYGLTALLLRSLLVAKMFLCSLPIVASLLVSRRLLCVKRFELAVVLTGSGLLFGCVLTALIVQINIAVISLTQLIGVLMVVPHLQGRRLISFMAATVITYSAIAAFLVLIRSNTILITDSERLIDVIGQTVVLSVAMFLLYQFSSRLKETVMRTVLAKAALDASFRERLEASEKVARLEREKDSANAASRAKNEFVANMSHEFSRLQKNAIMMLPSDGVGCRLHDGF